MLIHTIVMASSPERRATILQALEAVGDMVVRELPDGESLWAELSSRATDLVAVDSNAIIGSPRSFIGDLRATPESPEAIVFVGEGEKQQRAELQASLAFAVVDLESDEESAAEALRGLATRLAKQRQKDFLRIGLPNGVSTRSPP